MRTKMSNGFIVTSAIFMILFLLGLSNAMGSVDGAPVILVTFAILGVFFALHRHPIDNPNQEEKLAEYIANVRKGDIKLKYPDMESLLAYINENKKLLDHNDLQQFYKYQNDIEILGLEANPEGLVVYGNFICRPQEERLQNLKKQDQ